jgi:hypothetical protein
MSITFFNPLALPTSTQRNTKSTSLSVATEYSAPSEILSTESEWTSKSATSQSADQENNIVTTNHPDNKRDADDEIIAAWFKLMKPHHDRSANRKDAHHKNDPGRVPDPLYEPTKENVPNSLKIITFNDLMRALTPKKPHWKHYDDVSTQYQVGSQERD